jgi:hypothetical protein
LRKKQKTLVPKQLVFIDETAATTKMTRLYGRAPQGKRLVDKVPHGHWKTTTFICGLGYDAEKRSGTTTEGREELRTVLDFLRKGDILMVTRIDRLARSIGDLQDIVRSVKARGASLKATEQPIDTATAAGKCFLDMLGVFAEFETNLRRERQLEGIAKAKAAGVYKGRPASIDAAQVREMKAQGLGRLKDREGPRNRPGVGLSRIGGGPIGGSRRAPCSAKVAPIASRAKKV